jgi:hypothetical protein
MKSNELEHLLEWMGTRGWDAPAEDARRRAREIPHTEHAVPAVSTTARSLRPSDVRAASTLLDEDRRLVSHSARHVDLSLLVERHTERQGLLALEGRAWLADEQPRERAIDVVWAHDDHVIDHRRLGDGETFRFEGAPVRGWTLEIHVEGEPTVVLEDPGA